MPGGSTKKTCPFCKGILFCAQKKCSHCLKEQPVKQRLMKKLQKFDEKREEWVSGRKKNHNIASIKDEAMVMLEKLQAVGYKPLLLLVKDTKKSEVLTPRCTLTATAKHQLERIASLYEYYCEGCTQDASGEAIILNLTPCDPAEGSTTAGQVEQDEVRVGQEESSTTEGQVEQVEQDEVQVGQEESSTTEGQVEQVDASTTERQVEQEHASTTERQVEQQNTTKGKAVSRRSVRGAALPYQKKKSEAPKHLPPRKKPQKNCSYHTQLQAFPIRSMIKERVRKGKAEMLVDWEPCPVCGEQWPQSWQPKESIEDKQ